MALDTVAWLDLSELEHQPVLKVRVPWGNMRAAKGGRLSQDLRNGMTITVIDSDSGLVGFATLTQRDRDNRVVWLEIRDEDLVRAPNDPS